MFHFKSAGPDVLSEYSPLHKVLLLRKLTKVNMSYVRALCFFSIIFGLLNACRQDGRSTAAEKLLLDSLETEFFALGDSLDSAWAQMIEDDDFKIYYMRRLLDEVAGAGSADTLRYATLRDELGALEAMRYDRVSMAHSPSIDAYDSATAALSEEIIAFAREYQHVYNSPLILELIDEINFKNDMVIIYRVHYDHFAIRHNSIIREHSRLLEKRLGGGTLPKPLPLFQLPS